MDNLMAPHIDQQENQQFIEWVKSKYEDKDIGKVKVKYGKVHPYLGMTFNFEEESKLKIIMTEYVSKMINEFKYKDQIKDKVRTLAAEHIFKINNKCNKLNKEKTEVFHTYMAKGLFLCKRARPDIQLAIAFLTT